MQSSKYQNKETLAQNQYTLGHEAEKEVMSRSFFINLAEHKFIKSHNR